MLIEKLTRDGIEPEVTRPEPEKLVSGDPVHTTWTLDEAEGLYAGLWQSTPGAWRVNYEEWEYIRVHEGHSVLTGDDGSRVELRAGDSWLIRPGYSGVWEVLETTLKDYVIKV